MMMRALNGGVHHMARSPRPSTDAKTLNSSIRAKLAAASTKGSSRVQASHQPKPISMPRLPWHDAEQR